MPRKPRVTNTVSSTTRPVVCWATCCHAARGVHGWCKPPPAARPTIVARRRSGATAAATHRSVADSKLSSHGELSESVCYYCCMSCRARRSASAAEAHRHLHSRCATPSGSISHKLITQGLESSTGLHPPAQPNLATQERAPPRSTRVALTSVLHNMAMQTWGHSSSKSRGMAEYRRRYGIRYGYLLTDACMVRAAKRTITIQSKKISLHTNLDGKDTGGRGP